MPNCWASRPPAAGRSDDNSVTIRKRFHTFEHDSLPVVQDMEERGLLRRVEAAGSPDDVFVLVCQELGLDTKEPSREMA